jgi:hypothetical protein
MSPKIEESPEDKTSTRVAPSRSALLTRADAAALLHCSISSVRRLEGDVLHPIVGSDGVHRFDPAEVAHVSNHRSSRLVEGSQEGERDARVFEALEQGKGLREIVTTLRLPADLVSKLHASWLKMGSHQDTVLSGDRLAQLRAAIHADIKRPADLVEEVQWLAERCSALECERNNLDDQLSELVSAIGKMAARSSAVGTQLSELSDALAPELASRLAAAVTYFTDEGARSPSDPPSTENDETRPSEPHERPAQP